MTAEMAALHAECDELKKKCDELHRRVEELEEELEEERAAAAAQVLKAQENLEKITQEKNTVEMMCEEQRQARNKFEQLLTKLKAAIEEDFKNLGVDDRFGKGKAPIPPIGHNAQGESSVYWRTQCTLVISKLGVSVLRKRDNLFCVLQTQWDFKRRVWWE